MVQKNGGGVPTLGWCQQLTRPAEYFIQSSVTSVSAAVGVGTPVPSVGTSNLHRPGEAPTHGEAAHPRRPSLTALHPRNRRWVMSDDTALPYVTMYSHVDGIAPRALMAE